MTEFFTVTFTTKTAVTKISQKSPRSRKVITSEECVTPVTLERLTREKAMAYSGCENFTMTPYDPAAKLRAKGTGRDNSVGNGTVMKGICRGEVNVIPAGIKTGRSVVAEAARTGNLGASINV